MQAAKSASTFKPEIQGLRAIAILSVMLFHADQTWLPGGFLGVDIFFVISGYLITELLLRSNSKSTKQKILYFFSSRIRRIFPAYYFLLFIVAITATIFFIYNDKIYFDTSLLTAVFFISNIYFAKSGDYFSPEVETLPLLHTWSLAVEIQFYFIFPWLILWVSQNKLKIIIPSICLVLFILTSYYAYQYNPKAAYFLFPSRLPEFLVGSAASVWYKPLNSIFSHKKSLPINSISIVILFCCLYYMSADSILFPGISALPPTLATAFIIIFSHPNDKISNILSHKFLMWIGAISYSLYLYHWPILAFMRYYNDQYTLTNLQIFCYYILSFLAAIISFYLIERPFRKKIKMDRPINFIWKSFFYTLILFTSGILFLKFFEQRINQSIKSVSNEYARYADDSTICHGKIINNCLQGDINAKEPILLIGDSHAAMLNIFFDELGKKNHFSTKILTASSCVPIEGFNIDQLPKWAHTPCREQIEEVKKELSHIKIIVIAGYWSWQLQDPNFKKALKSFLETSSRNNQTVYLLADIPQMDQNPQKIERFKQLNIPLKFTENKKLLTTQANQEILDLTDKIPYVHFIDLSTLPIFSSPPYYQGELIYYDHHHLNEIGIHHYARQAEPQIVHLLNQE